MKEIPNKGFFEKKENGDFQNKVTTADEHADVILETYRMPFLMLGLDLPPPPLFQDVMEKNIIPQVILLSFVVYTLEF